MLSFAQFSLSLFINLFLTIHFFHNKDTKIKNKALNLLFIYFPWRISIEILLNKILWWCNCHWSSESSCIPDIWTCETREPKYLSKSVLKGCCVKSGLNSLIMCRVCSTPHREVGKQCLQFLQGNLSLNLNEYLNNIYNIYKFQLIFRELRDFHWGLQAD